MTEIQVREVITTQTCTRCGETKPRDGEHFPPDSRYRSGFQSWCRECQRVNRREKYRRNPQPDLEQRTAYNRAMRRLRERHLSEFEELYASELEAVR